MSNIENITPEDSFVPVFLVTPTKDEMAEMILADKENSSKEQRVLEQEQKKQSAIDKLKVLGLTDEEISAIIKV